MMRKIASQHVDAVTDTDSAASPNVQSIPTSYLFGNSFYAFSRPVDSLRSWLDEVLTCSERMQPPIFRYSFRS